MGRCHRCWGELADDHRCRTNWRWLLGELLSVTCGAAVGAAIQLMLDPQTLPAMGTIVGATLFSALPRLLHNLRDDYHYRVQQQRILTKEVRFTRLPAASLAQLASSPEPPARDGHRRARSRA